MSGLTAIFLNFDANVSLFGRARRFVAKFKVELAVVLILADAELSIFDGRLVPLVRQRRFGQENALFRRGRDFGAVGGGVYPLNALDIQV